jgi:hypothetical protein
VSKTKEDCIYYNSGLCLPTNEKCPGLCQGAKFEPEETATGAAEYEIDLQRDEERDERG